MRLHDNETYEKLGLLLGSEPWTVTSGYKQLAATCGHQWNRNPEATKTFECLSKDYSKLVRVYLDQGVSYLAMFKQFQQVFFGPSSRNGSGYNGYHSESSESSDSCSEESDVEEQDVFDVISEKIVDPKELRKKQSTVEKDVHIVDTVAAQKNADQLLAEEEREKKKADKRRAKKKRRKEKKKMEKEMGSKNNSRSEGVSGADGKHSKKKHISESSVSEEEGLDPNSAFVAIAASRNKKVASIVAASTVQETKKKTIAKKGSKEEEQQNIEDIDPVVLQSRQLAIRGNEMANMGHYQAAVDLFTEAIRLDPRDYRFFGNRSYCFDRLEQYDKALKDAEKAISLAPQWPKGYFRKGRALRGLNLYTDAEAAFEQVLKLDINCEDAMQELLKVRTHQIMEMGFSEAQAKAAVRQFGCVQAALDSLLAGVVAESSLSSEVYMSDEDEDDDSPPPKPVQPPPSDTKMDPKNPEGLTSLWVGNVLPQVTEKQLINLFSKHGTVTSVRLLPEKYCAFINYKDKIGAGRAMQYLQRHELAGQKILIRFPDNPIVNGQQNIIRKNKTSSITTIGKSNPTASTPTPGAASPGGSSLQKQTGPVNGDECYFWRTTGCMYEDKCRYKHIKDHKGMDRKPWQKSS